MKITDDEFILLSKFIKDFCGINLKVEKKALLISRLTGLLAELRMDSFMAFYKVVPERFRRRFGSLCGMLVGQHRPATAHANTITSIVGQGSRPMTPGMLYF